MGYSIWGRKESDTTEQLNAIQHSKVEDVAVSDPFQHLCITETLILVHKETWIRMLMWYVTICHRENGFNIWYIYAKEGFVALTMNVYLITKFQKYFKQQMK